MRLIAFILQSILFASPVLAGDGLVAEKSTVHAAFLYNFALLTEWPDPIDGDFNICILGDDPILKTLEAVKSKQVRGKSIHIMVLPSSAQSRSCHILYIAKQEHHDMRHIAHLIGDAPVLAVTEENSFDPADTIITFSEQDNRIGFKINLTQARKRSLNLSSKLLMLAKQVY